jgi:hypothetical protein
MPRIRKHQLCNEEASITSSKRVPSFQPKQQVEGEWDADSWHQGEVTELFQKTGQANIYDVNFKDGDSGTFLSQDLRALPVSAQDPILSSAALDSHSYILEDTIVSKRYAKNFRMQSMIFVHSLFQLKILIFRLQTFLKDLPRILGMKSIIAKRNVKVGIQITFFLNIP